jgi:hypothetical protein
MADDELWHVRISADEVKQLTLEQIDDLYRLEVIDADTQLWQDGMDEWLPLRVVAGLDEEEVVNISVPPTVPPANMVSTNSSWPPPAVARPSTTNSSWPPAVSPSVPPSARSVPPLAPSSRPAAFAATVPSWPSSGSGATSAPASPFGLSPSYAPPPASVRPQVLSPVPFDYPRPINPMPIVLAAVVGLTITLYRNNVLYAAARTVGQEATYLRLEAALGGPGFGTPRAVEGMAKAADALPDIPPPPAPTSTATSEMKTSESSGSSSTPASTATTKSTSTPTPETRKVSASAPASPQVQRAAAQRPQAPQAETPNPVFKQPKGAKKAKGNEFDPLNPSL